MCTLKEKTASLRTLLTPIIGEIKVKGYFSYIGFYKDELLIGLGKGEHFALRVTPTTKAEMQDFGAFPMESGWMPNTTQYFYWIPDENLPLLTHYPHWFFEALKYAEILKSRFQFGNGEYIRYLPNMSVFTERLLKRIGITTVEEFMAAGAMTMFIALIQKGVDVTDVLYLKLYGATERVYIEQYSQQTRARILKEANQRLAAEGVRYRLKGFAL